MKKVAVVILHYGSSKDTLECLESLSKVEVPWDTKVEVIVVDNGSKQKFEIRPFGFAQGENSKFEIDKVKIIRNEENLGFAGGNNIGIRYALEHGDDFVLILNNDTLVDKKLIWELLNAAEGDEKIGIVVPKIYFAPGFEFHKNRYSSKELGKVFWYAGGEMDWKNVIGYHRGVDEIDKGQYGETQETEVATGCCMMVKSEVFEKLGFFDEKYFLYYEDSDFSMRTKKAGFKILYTPKSVIWHKNAGSAGGSGSKLQDYYITRNRLLFGMRYVPLRSKFALLRESFLLVFGGRYWQKRAVLDYYLQRLRRGSYKI